MVLNQLFIPGSIHQSFLPLSEYFPEEEYDDYDPEEDVGKYVPRPQPAPAPAVTKRSSMRDEIYARRAELFRRKREEQARAAAFEEAFRNFYVPLPPAKVDVFDRRALMSERSRREKHERLARVQFSSGYSG